MLEFLSGLIARWIVQWFENLAIKIVIEFFSRMAARPAAGAQ
jgi:hypothetical protein